jgi:hypothetical protein
MAIAGRVAIVPKGDWSADATYKRLDAVTHNNTLYFAKKEVPAGTATSNTEYWSKSIVGGAGGVATADEAGVVKPADGLSIAEDGTLKVSIDGTTLTMDQVNNVIKLADTLKEKINGAFPAANVANNQITTVEGFALDARQANPNIDGTLAKQISDLNGSLNSTVVFDQDNIQITKISPQAYILHIDKLISLSEAWKEIVLGDIPFPCADTSTNIVTQNGDPVYLMIVNNKLKINTLVPSYKDETYIRCTMVISN